jgi:hypothetical protein
MVERAKRFLFKKGKSKINMMFEGKRKAAVAQDRSLAEDPSKKSRLDESIHIVNLQRDSTSQLLPIGESKTPNATRIKMIKLN